MNMFLLQLLQEKGKKTIIFYVNYNTDKAAKQKYYIVSTTVLVVVQLQSVFIKNKNKNKQTKCAKQYYQYCSSTSTVVLVVPLQSVLIKKKKEV